jgi:DNA-binding SARP family transcriptional activator
MRQYRTEVVDVKNTGNQIQIHTLGRFEICVDGKVVSGPLSHSKKLKSLMAYLILNHDRAVAYSELFDVLWPNEESGNPRNALKMLMYRLRNALTAGGAPEKMSFVVIQQGACQWNPFLSCDIDFEQVCELRKKLQREALSADERMEALTEIMQLYQGHFLGDSDSEMWSVAQDAYLHNLYLQSVNEMVQLLREDDLQEEIVALCRSSLQIDELDEDINRSLILALAALGRYSEAAQQFSHITELYYTQLGIQLPVELRELYGQLVNVENHASLDIDEIVRQLEEPEVPKGAFVCEYAIFRDLYRIEARCLERYGGRVFLGLLTVTDTECEQLPLRQLNKVMDQLLELVVGALRKGDIVSRFSPSQLVLLLPTVTQETGEMVLERIRKAYRRAHPKANVAIGCKLRPVVDPLQGTKKSENREQAEED